jgi:hypothetical protein
MSKPTPVARPKVLDAQCQNCEKVWRVEDLQEVRDLAQRVSPGEIVPAGECPDCHAVCSPIVHVVIEVKGGTIQVVHTSGPMSIYVVDWDDAAAGDMACDSYENNSLNDMPAETYAAVEEALSA